MGNGFPSQKPSCMTRCFPPGPTFILETSRALSAIAPWQLLWSNIHTSPTITLRIFNLSNPHRHLHLLRELPISILRLTIFYPCLQTNCRIGYLCMIILLFCQCKVSIAFINEIWHHYTWSPWLWLNDVSTFSAPKCMGWSSLHWKVEGGCMGRGGKNHDNAPTDEAKQALPTDLEGPPPALLEKTIISFHDESRPFAYAHPLNRMRERFNTGCRSIDGSASQSIDRSI